MLRLCMDAVCVYGFTPSLGLYRRLSPTGTPSLTRTAPSRPTGKGKDLFSFSFSFSDRDLLLQQAEWKELPVLQPESQGTGSRGRMI